MSADTAHRAGQVWRPIHSDARYTVSLEFCGYSVPLYCPRFCGEAIGSCRTFERAAHVCQTHKVDRDNVLTGPTG
jgi:hypothetical protein